MKPALSAEPRIGAASTGVGGAPVRTVGTVDAGTPLVLKRYRRCYDRLIFVDYFRQTAWAWLPFYCPSAVRAKLSWLHLLRTAPHNTERKKAGALIQPLGSCRHEHFQAKERNGWALLFGLVWGGRTANTSYRCFAYYTAYWTWAWEAARGEKAREPYVTSVVCAVVSCLLASRAAVPGIRFPVAGHHLVISARLADVWWCNQVGVPSPPHGPAAAVSSPCGVYRVLTVSRGSPPHPPHFNTFLCAHNRTID